MRFIVKGQPPPWLRFLASAAVLGVLIAWLEPAAVLAQLRSPSWIWLALGLGMSMPPLLLSAWRWRLTARLLALPLSWRDACAEYYLAVFVNQVMPGGVAGDALRAWRHGRGHGEQGVAWRAVIIERVSGQMAMALLTLAVLVASPLWRDRLAVVLTSAGFWQVVSVLAGCGVVAWAVLRRRRSVLLSRFWQDVRRALLHRGVWPKQLLGSLGVVLSYALIFVCAARGIGVTLPVTTLLALVPPVLLAMLVPVSVAGWGLREGAAAAVWALAGLPPAQGVAVSMAYGAICLLASLPGGLLLSRQSFAGPGTDDGYSIQDQVEQGVVAAGKAPGPWPQGVVQRLDGRGAQPRPTGADKQRRYQ